MSGAEDKTNYEFVSGGADSGANPEKRKPLPGEDEGAEQAAHGEA